MLSKIILKLLFILRKYISDSLYIKLVYRIKFKVWPNLAEPVTFNEKLNWLKLHDHNEKYTLMADKFLVKKYVSELIGAEYVVPCYGVWYKVEDFCSKELPEIYVLKTNHDSSGAKVITSNVSPKAFKSYKKVLKHNYFYNFREWAYKDIRPCILAEKCIVLGNDKIMDIKFLCFNGEPKLMYITNKVGEIYENWYDMNFNPVDVNHGFERVKPEFKKPEGFDEMKKIAAKLSHDIPFVRVDFFYVNSKIYFAEFTFYDWAGFRPFTNLEWDYRLGDMLKLPIH